MSRMVERTEDQTQEVVMMNIMYPDDCGRTMNLHSKCVLASLPVPAVMRSIGIPCRVITNFNSAHDNTGNLKTELIFKPDGTPDRRNTRDSIWSVQKTLSRE